MTTLRNYMEREQRTCAIHYVTAEARIAQGDWDGAEAEFARFRQQFEHHLGREELVLFPRLERAVGGTVMSTSLMRREHAQQRALIALMAEAICARNENEFFDLADTLRALTREHNRKEEDLVYPLAERLFDGCGGALLAALMARGAAPKACSTSSAA